MSAFLELRQISKNLNGRMILNEVCLTLQPGQSHILIGENGAGKSSICKIAGGVWAPDSGQILFESREVSIGNPRQAALDFGIRSILQEQMIFPRMTVADNLFMGQEPQQSICPFLIDQNKIYKTCAQLFRELGVDLDPAAILGKLSLGEQRLVEIFRAVIMKPRLIILDEVTASLTSKEVDMVFGVLRRLMRQGTTILLVTHRMEDLRRIGDSVTVLKEGQVAANGNLNEIGITEIVKLMAREKQVSFYPKLYRKPGQYLLETKLLGREPVIRGINLELRAGEVLGLAGLIGSGRTALARTITGIDPPTEGEIYIDGRRVKMSNPSSAVKNGMCYVTEDTQGKGLFLSLNVPANITITDVRRIQNHFFLDLCREEHLAKGFIRELGIGISGSPAAVSELSGGNQQKVVLAKWLYRNARIFVLDEPTKGLDILTKLDFYNIMNELTRSGAGIILISSDLQELQGMADRIIVLYEGEIAGVLSRDEATEERILLLATGGESQDRSDRIG